MPPDGSDPAEHTPIVQPSISETSIRTSLQAVKYLAPDSRGFRQPSTPALEANSEMSDQIIDAVMARSIHADAVRTHPLAAWVIVRDQIDYPGNLVARLVTDVLTPYVLLADSLGGVHVQLPPGLDPSFLLSKHISI